jgi:DNA replication protein DnaC
MKNTDKLEALLRSLHLKSFIRNYKDFSEKSHKQKLGHIEYLHELVQAESSERQIRKVERLIKEAKLPRGKTLDGFDLSKQPSLSPGRLKELGQGDFLDLCENLLIFGIPGSGKTHLSSGLAREWCLRGRRVFYTTAAALVQELLVAKRDLKLNEMIKKLDSFEAIVIDDVSYVPYTRDETDVLFVLLAARYETRSVVITSNLAFSDWGNIFKDPMTTQAAIDRLVHHSTILELTESYRQKYAKNRKKAQEEAQSKSKEPEIT